MPDDTNTPDAMTVAAEVAREELAANLASWTAKDVAAWFARWYLTAGHKRLGRVLVEASKS